MIKNRLLAILFIAFSILSYGQQTSNKFKFYGFVRSDFNYNSRQNVEAIDGLFHILPRPIEPSTSITDKNDISQAEMLSIATRMGVDITGNDLFGAKSSAKIETDLAGFGSNFYVLRIRQAYAKLNWTKTELLLGQTWHPLFGNVMPTTLSLNAGSPFQPFNRSPQLRIKYQLSTGVSVSAAAIYQMQYLSQGPIGASANYLKNALLPNFFAGAEYKTKCWTSGVGVDLKMIKPATENITSISAVVYTQYVTPKLQLKAKALLGQNLTDHCMIGGYGVSQMNSDSTVATKYTNFNTMSTWINAVYGTKVQVGGFLGISQNLGTSENLALSQTKKFTSYGYGNYEILTDQVVVDQVYRITPHISYNLPNLKFGLEYDFTSAKYGTLKKSGRVSSPYTVDNHRVVGTVSYFF